MSTGCPSCWPLGSRVSWPAFVRRLMRVQGLSFWCFWSLDIQGRNEVGTMPSGRAQGSCRSQKAGTAKDGTAARSLQLGFLGLRRLAGRCPPPHPPTCRLTGSCLVSPSQTRPVAAPPALHPARPTTAPGASAPKTGSRPPCPASRPRSVPRFPFVPVPALAHREFRAGP